MAVNISQQWHPLSPPSVLIVMFLPNERSPFDNSKRVRHQVRAKRIMFKEATALRYPQLSVVLNCGLLESRGLLAVPTVVLLALPRLENPTGHCLVLCSVSYSTYLSAPCACSGHGLQTSSTVAMSYVQQCEISINNNIDLTIPKQPNAGSTISCKR